MVRYRVVTDDQEVNAARLRRIAHGFSKAEIVRMYRDEVSRSMREVVPPTPGRLHKTGRLRNSIRVFVRAGEVVITMVYYGLFVDLGTRARPGNRGIRPRHFTERAREIALARLFRKLEGRDF